MATNNDSFPEPPSDPAEGQSLADAIDATLNRLLTDLAIEGELTAASGSAAEFLAKVRELGSPVLAQLAEAMAQAATAADLESATTRFAEAWKQWAVHGDAALTVAPVPAAPAAPEPASASAVANRVDEDVANLRADPEMAVMWVQDALEHLGTIEASVLQLEAAPGDVSLINDIFRPFHTVKGNSMAVGVMRVQELAHKVENLLDLCRSGKHALGQAEIDVVLEGVDLVTALVNDTSARLNGQDGVDLEPRRCSLMTRVDALVDGGEAAAAAPAAGAPAAATPSAASTPVTAAPAAPPVADGFSERASDVAAARNHPMRRAEDVSQVAVKVDTRKLDNLVDMVGELVIAQSIIQEDPSFKGVDGNLARNLAQLKRITSDLQRTAMSMRMVPIRQTFQKMARLVRDLSKKSGKPVDLVLSGEDTELDRRVVEDINDPLMHMIRNSMDHGIEDAERRAASGKRPEGRLALSAYHQGGNIVISIEDDGGGLNTDRILAKAISQGIVKPGESLSTSEIHQLIFKPGFSTAEKITEISGRGVGMDVVRQNIDALRGRVDIQSTPGQGTTFLIKLPLTLAILDGLVLGVGTQRYVMPTFAVRESLRPLPEQVHTLKGRPCMIQVRDKLVPLIWLSELYAIEARETDACAAVVVVIEDDGQQVGLVVDELLGKQEVVIKSLGEAFGQISGVAGGAILGDGQVGLILDAHGIVGRTRGDNARAA